MFYCNIGREESGPGLPMLQAWCSSRSGLVMPDPAHRGRERSSLLRFAIGSANSSSRARAARMRGLAPARIIVLGFRVAETAALPHVARWRCDACRCYTAHALCELCLWTARAPIRITTRTQVLDSSPCTGAVPSVTHRRSVRDETRRTNHCLEGRGLNACYLARWSLKRSC